MRPNGSTIPPALNTGGSPHQSLGNLNRGFAALLDFPEAPGAREGPGALDGGPSRNLRDCNRLGTLVPGFATCVRGKPENRRMKG